MSFASKNSTIMTQFKESFSTTFEVEFYRELKSFIRWMITKTPDEIFVTQTEQSKRLLSRFNMQDFNTVKTLLPSKVYISTRHVNEIPQNWNAHHSFWAIIRRISYVSHYTRPYIIFSVSAPSLSLHAQSSQYLSLSKRILRYIKCKSHYDLHFSRRTQDISNSVQLNVDADWGWCKSRIISTIGLFYNINGTTIFWKNKFQSIEASSLGKDEYVALPSHIKDTTSLCRLVFEMGNQKPLIDD